MLSVVVSTIGRPGPLMDLLGSLQSQEQPPTFELIVVDQSLDGQCLALLARSSWPFPVTGLSSGFGATLGRNVGAAVARGEILTFPDDDAFYRPDTLATAVNLLDDEVAAVSGIQVTRSGHPSMLRWLPTASDITLRNVQRTAIESGVFMHRSTFQELGGFNERMGPGSPGPFQAGEITDLLIRVLRTGARVRYDPEIVIVSDDPRDARVAGFQNKMLGYGRGMGHIYRRHPLPLWQLGYYCSRKVLGAPVKVAGGRRDLAQADLAWVKGAIQGYASDEAL